MRGKIVIDVDFTGDCTAVELKKEYTDYFDAEKYALVTELSETELFEKYGDLLEPYKPFVVITPEMADVICDYWRNEKKFELRNYRGHIFGIDEEFDEHHSECAVPDCSEGLLAAESNQELWAAINRLTPIQKQRVIKHFFQGKNSRIIAAEEGVYYSAVDKSLQAAVEKLKKFLS